MTSQEPDVHGRCTALDRGEVVGEGLPREFQPGLEGHQRDGLDPREQTDEKFGRGRVNGGQRNTAIARDHSRDTVEWRGRECRVPQHLRVVVGMDIDEARADHEACGIDHPAGGVGRRTD